MTDIIGIYFVDGREQLGAVIICSRIIKYYITRGRENKR